MSELAIQPPRRWLPCLLLVLCTALGLWLTRPAAYQITWADETLYYTVGENIALNFDFNSRHYLSESLRQKGFPTKDTHTPGYPMLLAAGFKLGGVHPLTAFLINYLLLAFTVFLVAKIGSRFAGPWWGFAAGALFLLYPMTYPLTQAIMSEPAATATITAIAAVLFLKADGWWKGILLGALLIFATLIKPFLLAFLPAVALVVFLEKRDGRYRTLISLALTLLASFLVVMRPLLANREFYPYPAADIFTQANWRAVLARIGANLQRNRDKFVALKWREGEGMTTISMGLLWVASLGFFIAHRIRIRKNGGKGFQDAYTRLFIFTVAAFVPIVSALFLLYEYHALRGIRALSCFSPLLALLVSLGFADGLKSSSRAASRAFRLVPAVMLGMILVLASYLALKEIRNSQAFQYRLMTVHYNRLSKFVTSQGLNPQWPVSRQNFLFPILRYPARMIWWPPNSLKELAEISAVVPIDLLELKENEAIVRENRKLRNNDDSEMGAYRLLAKGGGYLYYVPVRSSAQ